MKPKGPELTVDELSNLWALIAVWDETEPGLASLEPSDAVDTYINQLLLERYNTGKQSK